MKVYVAMHHHRYGQTAYLFAFLPTEERVIQEIESETTWEPEREEWIEILGPEEVINDQRIPPTPEDNIRAALEDLTASAEEVINRWEHGELTDSVNEAKRVLASNPKV